MQGEIKKEDFEKDSQNVKLTYQVGKTWEEKYFDMLSHALNAGQILTRRGKQFEVSYMSRNYYSFSSIRYEAGTKF